MRKYWTKEEDLFLINNIKSSSLKELSDKLNRTISSVKERTGTLKIRRPSLREKKPKVSERFGNLTVISIDSKKSREHVMCSCACGTKKDIRVYSLWNGSTTSCGCRLYRMNERSNPGDVTYLWAYKTYKENARKQKRNFDLSLEEFKKIARLNCHYCGVAPRLVNRYLDKLGKQRRKNKEYQQSTIDFTYAKINGLDRVNNDLGYNINNVVPCCLICNRAKNSMSYRDFTQWINGIKLNEIA